MLHPRLIRFFLFIAVISIITSTPTAFSQTNQTPIKRYVTQNEIFRTCDPILRFEKGESLVTIFAYPLDPTSDIGWRAGYSGVSDIQNAFNNARTTENSQLGTLIPMLTLPSQSEWDAMLDGEKALWLINRERIDRGIDPLHGLEENVTSVAQYYAGYLLDNDAWGHYEDGLSPWERLASNPAIGVCYDFLNVAENLAYFGTSGSSIDLPIERSIYMWMYDDGDCCSWGHRHAILWYPYNDNSGTLGMEGFIGIGRASGGPYYFDGIDWNYAEIIVMNVFDPCSDWDYQLDADSEDDGVNGDDTGDDTGSYSDNDGGSGGCFIRNLF